MRRPSRVSLCLGLAAAVLLVVSWSPGAQTAFGPREAAIAQMLSEVSADRLAGTIDQFMNVATRFSPTSGCRTIGTSIYNYFSRLSLDANYDAFRYNSPRAGPMPSGRNVVATLRGIDSPDQIVVVGAHYDSTSNEPWRSAPGADDNASGTAAVLEIARILSSRRFNLTIKLIAFDAEELGTFGSEHVAVGMKARREQIVAVLILDMVGYDDGGRKGLAVVPDRRSEWLADRLIQTVGRYALTLKTVKRVNVRWARSDEATFWAKGYPAIDVIEDMPDSNPYYHTLRDTPETLNIRFLADVTRATLATVADLAEPTTRAER